MSCSMLRMLRVPQRDLLLRTVLKRYTHKRKKTKANLNRRNLPQMTTWTLMPWTAMIWVMMIKSLMFRKNPRLVRHYQTKQQEQLLSWFWYCFSFLHFAVSIHTLKPTFSIRQLSQTSLSSTTTNHCGQLTKLHINIWLKLRDRRTMSIRWYILKHLILKVKKKQQLWQFKISVALITTSTIWNWEKKNSQLKINMDGQWKMERIILKLDSQSFILRKHMQRLNRFWIYSRHFSFVVF